MRDQIEPLAIVPKKAHPSPSPAVLPVHFDSLDAFREHYIETRLGGDDPDLGEDEWEAMFMEALDDFEARLSQSLQAESPASAPRTAIAIATEPEIPSGRIRASDEALAALELCRWVVTRQPKASDLVDSWFTDNTVRRLKPAGLLTLQLLVDAINRRGQRWWARIEGLGPIRGQRITEWLQTVGAEAGLALRSGVTSPVAYARAARRSWQMALPGWDRYSALGLEPLALVVSQQGVDGVPGSFHLSGDLLLGARTDLEAIAAALSTYTDRRATLAVYSREMCRFALWCYFVRQKRISALGAHEAMAFKTFLSDVPIDWINPVPTPRATLGWRPFRGQLDEVSRRKALTSVHVILHQLELASYISANPMSDVLKLTRTL